MGLWGPPDQFLRILYGGSPPSGQFLCLLYGAPQISFFAHYMEASSGQFLRLLYVEAPLDNFLRLLYGAPLWSVSSLTIWGPAPQINFFASYVGASSDQFLRILYRGPPQVIFFAYRGPSVQFLCLLYGAPLRSISLLPMWGPLQISFFAYYIGAPSGHFLRL